MAKMNNPGIWYEPRICMVDGRPGYFHCWEQYCGVISPGLTVGSHPGGQFARVFGIVEFKEGMECVDIHKIKFCGREIREDSQGNWVIFD